MTPTDLETLTGDTYGTANYGPVLTVVLTAVTFGTANDGPIYKAS